MKTTFTTLFAAISFSVSAQSTPSEIVFPDQHINVSNSVRDYGDTMDFEGYASNTPITNNYWGNGAIYSGYDGSGIPVTYDYGINIYTSVLHSDDWYNPLKLRFVDVNDTNIAKPISHLSFYNPVSSEIDYIKVQVFDNEDNVVASYMSVSPEWVSIDVPTNNGSYVVFDDSAYTAYVIDLVSFNPGGKATGVAAMDNTSIQSVVYPNPVDESFAIMIISQEKIVDAVVKVYNQTGTLVKLEFLRSNAVTLKKGDFSAGIYFYTIVNADNRLSCGTFMVQ